MGFAKVETFIASGNVVFDSLSKNAAALEKKIETCLLKNLGYEVKTFIRTTGELAAVSSYAPFNPAEFNAETTVLYIAFLERSSSEEAVQKLKAYITATDDFHVQGREFYWLCRTRMSDSQFSGARLEKILGMRCTIRNSTTVRKMAAKYP